MLSFILFRLSGESPFQGDNDADTLALVTAAQWEFDEESFDEITEEAQDFISSLLQRDPRWFIVTCLGATRCSCRLLTPTTLSVFQEKDVL